MPTDTKINGNFKGKDILSLDQFTPQDLELLFKHTNSMKEIFIKAQPSDLLKGNIVALIFYEPSTRTFNSFSAAIKQLGGATIENQNPEQNSSVAKGESLDDTIRVLEAYSDAIVIRHPTPGTATKAAEAAKFVPILNAGDGIGEHPTQALLDLYTIEQKFGRLNNLTILFAGDIFNGRTVHSLLKGLSLFKNNTAYLLSPKALKLSDDDKKTFQNRGIKIIEIISEKDIPKNADIWYWTRVQKERFANLEDYEKVKNTFVVTKQFLENHGNKNMILMHPLPRVGEISPEIDNDERAMYLTTQIRNGVYVRMALFALVLGKLH